MTKPDVPVRTGRRNRVRPDGQIVADPARGTMWGNRGALLGAAGQPTRRPTTIAWVCCVLEFKGWKRVQWQPGRLTELYFLDEATALAAGHRPCGLCRSADYRRFRDAWSVATGGARPGAPEMDARLQADRRTPDGGQRTFEARLDELPDGTIARHEGEDGLVWRRFWLPWSMAGYGAPRDVSQRTVVQVLTPRTTVAALASGYVPMVHPSAERA